jgi:membrane protein implicated in regulation of membrane protease activity
MDMSSAEIWLIVGVLLLLLEAFGMSGVGLLFAGLGCLSVGAFLNLELIASDNTLVHFVWFFAMTALWTAVLWKPMQRFYSSRNKKGYKNMVGDTAYVSAGGLSKSSGGDVTWSGTTMKAELDKDSVTETLAGGAAVIIIDVRGATLIVTPKLPA